MVEIMKESLNGKYVDERGFADSGRSGGMSQHGFEKIHQLYRLSNPCTFMKYIVWNSLHENGKR